MKTAIGNLFTVEHMLTTTSKDHIDQLLVQCFTNVGESLYTNKIYQQELLEYGAFISDSDLTRASKYIVNASNSITATNAEKGQKFVRLVLQRLINESADLCAADTARYINDQYCDVFVKVPVRAPNIQQRYPGVGGGTFLQAYIETLSVKLPRGFVWFNKAEIADHTCGGELRPFNRVVNPSLSHSNSNYVNIACFLLGSHMRAHGFNDGNGRTVRTLFACAMLKSGQPFVAPNKKFEDMLTGLND